MSKKILSLSITVLASTALLTSCADGSQFAGNVYKSDQVNQTQEAKTVKILAVLPAKVEVDNAEGKKNAQIIGGLLGVVGGAVVGNQASSAPTKANNTVLGGAAGGVAGAAAGSLVKDKVLVDGVSITYTRNKKTLHAVQVGKLCEFTPGTAIVISAGKNETRIQPNATCSKEK